MMLCGVVDEEILADLGHLPKYPTSSKAVGFHGIWRRVYFAWAIEPSLQNGAVPRNGFMFFDCWAGRAAGVRPFRL